jgi:1-acyl-sn-glycerol-3-phosphate acyltransferase
MRFLRSAATLLLFAAFALGGAVLSSLVLPFVRDRRRGHRIVRGVWRLLIASVQWTRLISVDASGLKPCRGRIIVANHPSLIDVVILVALVPDSYAIAKSQLKDNPFFGYIVRNIMLPNDEQVLERSGEIIAAGGNVLIFPEGTRTPPGDVAGPKLHRGAAQLAIRLGVPVSPVRIEVSRRILGKNQSILDMGERTVAYRLVSGADIVPPEKSEVSNRAGALAMTAAIGQALQKA